MSGSMSSRQRTELWTGSENYLTRLFGAAMSGSLNATEKGQYEYDYENDSNDA
jgi:hypothetical protein